MGRSKRKKTLNLKYASGDYVVDEGVDPDDEEVDPNDQEFDPDYVQGEQSDSLSPDSRKRKRIRILRTHHRNQRESIRGSLVGYRVIRIIKMTVRRKYSPQSKTG